MEVSTEKSKVIKENTSDISADISMNGQMLEKVASLKFLEASLCKDGTCSAEIYITIASKMAATANLNNIWRNNNSSIASKLKLCTSLGTSIF